ncbi:MULTISPECIES: 30S ribosomal protein S16 [Alloalcanivorax]|jgi:small subunit ribosomal protein S16|uniref:Small ribosomal subunit protein bS16 n=2 Tax=Alloalcanivorax TaxID=3020832 RepID=A0A9Q3ZGA1_9GAMM|nr:MULTISPECIES: 30S ribosomal protein S16 [Alloalcanivorax]ERS13678.1 30S ribosomal protein S16 [Alcanivorax sp. PN-3]KYZ87259.1 30S ribosomal protein S16 [Alcanivorax sp. KX64203]MBA4723183.1 30S ribosomal protein S16 [Alcanivorax sp.]ARB45128.1 30S ribosomal protein S16 [Alloalcanivorax xenomutans]MCE7509144.1 30S ribosomal protein S16 [Alloalcanivorax xenomutans]|tara:strand:+ start:99 stop:353 length:255 start_codon:yes stop_codon:yes gene_type:complete
MLVIRLARGGSKKRPFYQIIATDSRNARDGRFIERLGYFNPIARGGEIRLKVDLEAVDQWVQKGAQLSDRVKNLVKEARKSESA